MELQEKRTLNEFKTPDTYRLDIEKFGEKGIGECEVKPCRKILLLRYPG